MHAPVHAREVGQEVERAGIALDERVVQPYLDIGMRVERGEGRIESLCIHVVEQQPYPHPPLGRLPERLEQQVADLVAMPDVVLRVERLFGGVGEQDARGERVAGVRQRMDARLAGIRSDAGRNRAAELRPRRVGEGGGLDAILWRGQRGTAGNDHHKRDQEGGQNAVHLRVTDRCCETVSRGILRYLARYSWHITHSMCRCWFQFIASG